MKKILDYINEELTPFEQHLLQHISIDYNIYHNYTIYYVDESAESFPKLDRLCASIAGKIYDAIENMKKTGSWKDFDLNYSNNAFKDVENVFFDEIEIYVKHSNKGGSNYTHKNAKINSKNYLLNIVQIEYFHDKTQMTDYSNIYQKVCHEIAHAYDDYKSLLENGHLFDCATELLRKTANLKKGGFVEKYLSDIIYFTMDVEQSAFESELMAELKSNKNTVKCPKDALKCIKSSNIFSTYQGLLTVINNRYKGKSSEDVKIITDKYNEIFETELNSEEVIDTLYKRINDSIKRFEDMAGDICLRCLKNVQVLPDSTRMLKEALEKYCIE